MKWDKYTETTEKGFRSQVAYLMGAGYQVVNDRSPDSIHLQRDGEDVVVIFWNPKAGD